MPDIDQQRHAAAPAAAISADAVRDALLDALANLGVDEDTIAPGAHLHNDLELDSIDIVQLEQDLTKRLGFRVEMADHTDLTVATTCEQVLLQAAATVGAH